MIKATPHLRMNDCGAHSESPAFLRAHFPEIENCDMKWEAPQGAQHGALNNNRKAKS